MSHTAAIAATWAIFVGGFLLAMLVAGWWRERRERREIAAYRRLLDFPTAAEVDEWMRTLPGREADR